MLGASIAAQFAVNHGLIKAEHASGLGAMPVDHLAAMAEGMAPPAPPPAESHMEPPTSHVEPPGTPADQALAEQEQAEYEDAVRDAHNNGQRYEDMPAAYVVS